MLIITERGANLSSKLTYNNRRALHTKILSPASHLPKFQGWKNLKMCQFIKKTIWKIRHMQQMYVSCQQSSTNIFHQDQVTFAPFCSYVVGLWLSAIIKSFARGYQGISVTEEVYRGVRCDLNELTDISKKTLNFKLNMTVSKFPLCYLIRVSLRLCILHLLSEKRK
jgi:hypothetical protein